MIDNRIGEFIRSERKRRGITQVEMAKLTGVNKNSIINFEKGSGLLSTAVSIISVFWDDMQSFGEDYNEWLK